MCVDYNHSENLHSLAGPQAALPVLFAKQKPSSLLDVGCGTGTWLRAAIDFGIQEVLGVDGVEISPEKLHVPAGRIRHQDLTCPWNLGTRFGAALCLEVAEHLDATYAPVLIDALVQHSDRIFFSAACPGQEGQHHVNCQWPAYWQEIFNQRGFNCSDELRWQIWDEPRIEPWYRQNIFIARRDEGSAGYEPRIRAVVHPEMLPSVVSENNRFESHVREIEKGRAPASWYLKTPMLALVNKVKRHMS
jgi:SAM-dependent methyltransferase